MDEQAIDNQKLVRSSNFKPNGRFAKGNNANPKGNNQFTTIVPLLEALKKSGQEYKEDFWEFVAKKVRTSDAVLIAILKKLLPDKIEGEGFDGETKIIIIRAQKKNERTHDNIEAIPR